MATLRMNSNVVKATEMMRNNHQLTIRKTAEEMNMKREK
jgi:hypothetical protein